MSRKRKTKNRKRVEKVTEKPEIVIREVEIGGLVGKDEQESSLGVEEKGDDGGDAAKDGADEHKGDGTIEGEQSEQRTSYERNEGERDGQRAPHERSKGGKLHKINVYYPWLKFVAALVLVAGVVFGGIGAERMIEGAMREAPVGSSTEVSTDEPEGEGQGSEIAEKPTTGETEEDPSEGEDDGADDENEVKPPVVPDTEGKKLVALTFDDGPSAATTGRLLDILKAKGVRATFFVVGSMAQRSPDLVRREAAEGHEVGSHSTYHQDLSKLGAADLQAEVAEMDRIFTEILGRKAGIMRPPYGAVSDVMRGYLGKPMIYWAVDPLDWKYRDAATVRGNVVGATFDGAVVLLHDIHSSTVDAVAGIIDDLRAQGYEFLTVSELAAARGVSLSNGVVYYHFKP